mmetsp:Transcript_2474/g.2586  ORF Transcript_2474/g.2586 Transcript_2474/m.2586 type:complete len:81 (-) Transcript_2474:1024-1266(-)
MNFNIQWLLYHYLMPKYTKIISNIKKITGLKTEKEIIREISPEIKSILKTSSDTAVISKKDKDIEVTIKKFKKERGLWCF